MFTPKSVETFTWVHKRAVPDMAPQAAAEVER